MQSSVAIVGASADRAKFGNKALRAYVHAGWSVYPVNPRVSAIEELNCYRSIVDVPDRIDRVSMYVPPAAGLGMLDDMVSCNPREVYFNPGSEDAELLRQVSERGLNVVAACSIVDIGLSPSQFPDQ